MKLQTLGIDLGKAVLHLVRLGISKRGNTYLRTLFVQSAGKPSENGCSDWLPWLQGSARLDP
jgi:transposase